MKFINYNKLDEVTKFNNRNFMKIEPTSKEYLDLVAKIGEHNKDDEALNILRRFNKNITSIDTKAGIYYVNATELGFYDLSRGERLFLLVYSAIVSGSTIYLQHDVKQLTKTNLELLFDMIRDYDNINIVYYDDYELSCYKLFIGE